MEQTIECGADLRRWNGAHRGADGCNSLRRRRKGIPVIDVVVFNGVLHLNDVELGGRTDHVGRAAVGVGTADRLHLPADSGERRRV